VAGNFFRLTLRKTLALLGFVVSLALFSMYFPIHVVGISAGVVLLGILIRDYWVSYQRLLLIRKTTPQESSPLSENQQLTIEFISSLLSKEGPYTILASRQDPNIIDGSSIWLSQAVKALRLLGDVVVITPHNVKPEFWQSPRHRSPDEGRVLLISPNAIGARTFSNGKISEILSVFLDLSPAPARIVSRGLELAKTISEVLPTSVPHATFMTDYYSLEQMPELVIDEVAKTSIRLLASSGTIFLTQTEASMKHIKEVCQGLEPQFAEYPPIAARPKSQTNSYADNPPNGVIRLLCAGTYRPFWGVKEFVQFTDHLIQSGFQVESLLLVGKTHTALKREAKKLGRKPNLRVLYGLRQQEVISYLQTSGLAFCWRSPELERNTPEISTKLIEAVSLGVPVLAFPNEQNIALLGADYPGLVEDPADFVEAFERLMATNRGVFDTLGGATREKHSHEVVAANLNQAFNRRLA
jgi:glycosyltransferase involved in cell wall biosynthesis